MPPKATSKSYWVGDGPGPGHLIMSEIKEFDGDFGYAVLNKVFREAVPWLAGGRRGIIFALREPGRAAGFGEIEFQPKLDAFLKEAPPLTTYEASTQFFRGWWDADEYMYVPDPVTAHVIGGFATSGPVWLWARQDRLEVWSEAYRIARTQTTGDKFGPLVAD